VPSSAYSKASLQFHQQGLLWNLSKQIHCSEQKPVLAKEVGKVKAFS
jgi:hypothetical protein